MYEVLVTGGAGFIGSHFVRQILRRDGVSRVTVLDALTYAGHPENLGEAFLDTIPASRKPPPLSSWDR